MVLALLAALLAPVVLAQPAPAAGPPAPAVALTLNGRPLTPEFVHLDGSPERPAAGDLVAVARYLMPLGPDREQTFHLRDGGEGILWAESGGRQRVVAVEVRWKFTDEKDATGRYRRVLVNPLDGLEADDIRGLRCVKLDAWADGLAAALSHLDPGRACVVVSGDAVVGPDRRLAPLPAGLRYLRVEENNNIDGIRDYQRLAGLTDLRYLGVRTMVAPFDCRHLGGAKRLTHLVLHAPDLQNPEALSGLTGLRHLDLRGNRGLRSVAFAAGLTDLLALDLSYSGVDDLTPLGGHPTLREIGADSTALRRLPLDRPLPSLRRLDALSARVSDADAAAFAKLNPRCRVAVRWEGKLAEALAGADRVRVRTGGTCHRQPDKERTLHDERDAGRVRALVAEIKVDEPKSGFHCGCCGEPSIEFYRGGTLLLTLGYHHDRSVRWVGGWPGDALLTARSAEHLKGWLAANVLEIRQAQEAARAAARREAEAVERFVGHFPEGVRPLLRAGAEVDPVEGDKDLGRRLAAAMPDEKARLVAACRAFGTLDGRSASWSATTGKERRVLAAVGGAGGEAFLRALEEVKADRAALLGAARLFFFEDFDERIPAGARAGWTARLAEVALADGSDHNKPLVLRALARQTDPATGALLREVMLGKKGTAIAEPYADEPGLRAAAALGLALRQEKDVAPEVAKLLARPAGKPDAAACQVALALLGDPAQLRAEHFELRSYTIGYGAVRAVERFGGRHGLDLLIEHGLSHPWAAVGSEAERAVERITGRQFPEDDRGRAIRAWWKEHGPAFVEQRRKGTGNPR